FVAPTAGANGRFAINYRVANGGPSGANSDYIGIDLIRVLGPAAPPATCNFVANQWTTRPVVPNASYFGASAWIGDTLYFQAPTSAGAATTTIYRYTYNGSWSTGVPMPGALVGGSMVAAGGRLYYVGGSATGVTTGGTTVYSYNPGTGTWSTMAPLPAALSGHQAVNWGDSVLIVVGGPWTGSGTNLAHHYYRIGSNTWGTTASSLPSGQGRRTFAMAINGNKIVVSSGFNTAFIKSTYVGTIGSNASTITWVAAPDVPTTESGLSRPGSTSFGNWFFLVGGERGTTTGYSDITYVFNTTSNTWSGQISGLPFPRSNIMGHITAKCINDTLSLFCPAGYGIVGGIGTGAATDLFHITRAGVFTSTGNNTTSTPDKFELSQNYPNPFNPSTVINFSLPSSSLVTLKVYDITGREVKTLVNELRGAGRYDVTFDASNFATGVYFYTLETENFTQTKKMLLVK
ncbi:MAG TPA: T9SS type A sorting domain-containing protein, partial [Ignavibacteria bacterium]|nr:T9SS type A sorting domain-containing protein [Ignavibacteria bacterium]